MECLDAGGRDVFHQQSEIAFGNLNNMFGSRASVISAPFDIFAFVDFMAESTVAKTDLHCVLN